MGKVGKELTLISRSYVKTQVLWYTHVIRVEASQGQEELRITGHPELSNCEF